VAGHGKMDECIEQLIKKAQKGNKRAWKGILTLYEKRILKCIWDWVRNCRYSGNVHIDPYDLLSETFLRAYEGLPKLNLSDYDDLYQWLYGIAHRVFINGLRRAENEPRLVDIGKVDNSAFYHQNIIDDIESRELWETLQKALESLSESDKEIIDLRYYHGLSYAAIAKRKGMSEGAVRVRCLRARQRLKSKLKGNKTIDEYLEDWRDQK
jgi:RNA polymerase sigma-70 factor (ECF subfamily)